MTEPEVERYNVGAVKIPAEQRDVARAVLSDDAAVQDRAYRDVIGSDTSDDDEKFPVGANVVYNLKLTPEEADQFASASNCRYVEKDRQGHMTRAVGRMPGLTELPDIATLAHMRARYVDLRRWHGRDVKICVIDSGTSSVVRRLMGFNFLARTVVNADQAPDDGEPIRDPDGVPYDHGSFVACNAVPAGGQLMEALYIDSATGGFLYSSLAVALRWAADNGAQVANVSGASTTDFDAADNFSQTILDAIDYTTASGMQIVFSAGNNNLAQLAYPSSISRTHTDVHSSIAFDEVTDRRGLFSNHASDASGSASGVAISSLDAEGYPARWYGTSASAPCMVQMIARGATGGTFTARQVAAALRANPRDTGAGASEQGLGAWDLQRALTALGAAPGVSTTSGVAAVSHIDTQGASPAGGASFYNLGNAASQTTDDLRLLVAFSAHDASIVTPPNWRTLLDARYTADLERDTAGTSSFPHDIPSVTPTALRVRVLSHTVTADEPGSTLLSWGNGVWFSAVGLSTFRGSGGLDPEQFSPVVRFGTGVSVTALSVLPRNANDLLVNVFMFRHSTNAPAATLSLPAGLTQQGFFRPASGTAGYAMLVATQQLASGARTSSYVSTSNDASGTWASLAFTVPAADAAIAPVVQSEPAFPAHAFLPFFQGA